MPAASVPCKGPPSLLVLRIAGSLRSLSSAWRVPLLEPRQSPSPDSCAFDGPSRRTCTTPGHHISCGVSHAATNDSGVSNGAGRGELAANVCLYVSGQTRSARDNQVVVASSLTIIFSSNLVPTERPHCHLNIPFSFNPTLWGHDLVGAASRSRIRSS